MNRLFRIQRHHFQEGKCASPSTNKAKTGINMFKRQCLWGAYKNNDHSVLRKNRNG